jgi:hypothetical protein
LTVLRQPYAERDVEDVEAYVRHTVTSIAPGVVPDDREELVARGILLVSRMARALPPEASLAAFLDERLSGSLAVYRRRLASHAEHAGASPAHPAPATRAA